MAQLLKNDFKPRDALSDISADWLNDVAKRLNGMRGADGVTVEKVPDGIVIRLGDDTFAFQKIWSCVPTFVDGVLTSLSFVPYIALVQAVENDPDALTVAVEPCDGT